MPLKLRLLLTTLVLPLLLMLAVAVITLSLHRDDHDAELEAELYQATALVEPSLLAALRAEDLPALRTHTASLLGLREVTAAAIIDASGMPLIEAGRLTQGAPLAHTSAIVRQNNGHWRMTYPLADDDATRLVMDIDASGLLLGHYRQLGASGLLLVLGAAILGLATASTYRRLQRPLARIDATLSQLAREESAQPLPPSPPELPPLDTHINVLASRLQASREEMQRQIAQATMELEESMETVEIQNMQLDMAHRRAVEANRVKSEFLANMSHEIRTPLNGIIGFCRLLGRSPLDVRQQEWLEHVDRACDNLLMLVNDILDYSRLEAGRLELERMPVEMVELVDEVLALQAPTAQQKGLELLGMVYDDVPSLLEGDPMRIRQVLTNLVGNAVKFTEHGDVLVRVMVEESESDRVTLRISVTDTGIGLSNEHRQRLFDAFHQTSPSHSREFGGSGLGLFICRQLVEQMGGEIDVQSEPGHGSTFSFTLPLAGEAESQRPPELHLKGETILLEEPHAPSRHTLLHLLRRWGATPLPADTASPPLPSLLIVSLGAPPYAPELLHHWQERIVELQCPALVLCTVSPLELPDIMLPAGGEMLAKPLARRAFADAIERILASGQHAGAAATERSADTPDTGLRLLAVDDNDSNRRLLSELLTGPGLEVTLASGGEQAVSLGRKQHFDLVLMDIRMPGMDGVEATRALRRLNQRWRRTPIIAVTAHALEDERRRLLASGLDDVLIKPLGGKDLAALLSRHLGSVPAHLMATDTSSADARSSELAAVDLSLGARLAGGREQLAHQLLVQLADSLDASEKAIYQAYEDRDDEALLDAIHALNGACRYCGAPRLGLLAETMETRLRSRGRMAMAPLMGDLTDAMEELRRWRKAQLEETQSSSTTKATANSSSSDRVR
ncbi:MULTISPECIES: ATP-binding protein [unclassified Halomonas]|uniref:ATP-binding protein n=1 Tax=unclassified Halomonas TaxID=2609666 RepID=UPI002884F7D9|nr:MULTISPECIES: ATP-binding protein [unclassified Halomonas]MDT0501144.1 ATP-binding protein [Halomonas sp. PAR7]MDT0511477.1 ATP-binding protein [Halomonas sp. LES1]MDT0590235.1 ATP-binding protein [Halomonas sp. PAR8]